MTTPNPITPPPELVQQWTHEWNTLGVRHPDATNTASYVATRAAQYGADKELAACCEEMKSLPNPLGIPFGEMASNALRAARRSKPPSLKEQALEQLDGIAAVFRASHGGDLVCDTIRRVLEQLDD